MIDALEQLKRDKDVSEQVNFLFEYSLKTHSWTINEIIEELWAYFYKKYLMLAQKKGFSKQTLKEATGASFCLILDQDKALESPNAEL